MRQIKFRGRLEDTDKIIFFELGEVESVADGLFSKRFDDYVADVEQFIATDKNGFDVYENDILIDDLEQEHIAEIYDRPAFIAQLTLMENAND